jgi:CubicO group peptidase (beta-lactamase class C family)
MVKHTWLVLLVLVAVLGIVPIAPTRAQESPDIPWPTEGWLTSTPEEQGLSSEQLAEMFEYVAERDIALHSVLVIRNGTIVAEAYLPPYDADTTHQIYSCTKSFTSALVGIAIEEEYIEGVDQHVLDFFPDRTFDNLDDSKASMTLDDFLTMRAGLDWPDDDMSLTYQMATQRDWVQFVLDRPMAVEPGTEFLYNNGVTHVLSAVVQQATGMTLEEYAEPRLFEPLGITHYRWGQDWQGITIGAWDLYLTPRDMAKFGYLYLNGGVWDGVQVVPADWVQQSTRAHVVFENVGTGDQTGYGYQWWIYPRTDVFAAEGLDGQYIVVAPNLNMVVVFTADLQGRDSAIPLRLLVDYVAPAVLSTKALTPNPAGVAELEAAIDELAR